MFSQKVQKRSWKKKQTWAFWRVKGFWCQPYPASFEHPSVHQVRTHQSHVDAVLLRGFQLVAQRLVEPDGTKLAGAVILQGLKERENKLVLRSCARVCTHEPATASSHMAPGHPGLYLLLMTHSQWRVLFYSFISILLQYIRRAHGRAEGFDVVHSGNNLRRKERRDGLSKHRWTWRNTGG